MVAVFLKQYPTSPTLSVPVAVIVNSPVAVLAEVSELSTGATVSAGDTGTVLTVIVTVLSTSDPSMLKFPAASENLLLATFKTPFEVLFGVGVNVTVYVEPLPEKSLIVPPDTVMSLITKSDTGSLMAKLIVAVWSIVRLDRLLATEMVGGVKSPPHPLIKSANAQTTGRNSLFMVRRLHG